MRRMIMVSIVVALGTWAATVQAEEKTLKDIPKDAWNLGTVWTEPFKSVAKETRRVNPISGLWHGLWNGSVNTFKRTAAFLIQEDDITPEEQEDDPKDNPLLRYSF